MKLLSAVALLSLTGCHWAMLKVVGVRQPKLLSLEQIARSATKLGIPDSVSFQVDTSAYYDFMIGLEQQTNGKGIQKDLYQPLQVRAYDSEGHLTLNYVNCYMGGFPNLKWNRGEFDSFPLRHHDGVARMDTAFTIAHDLRFIRPVLQPGSPRIDWGSNEEIIVVYWSAFMGRQTKVLLKNVRDHHVQFPNNRIQVVYVNFDNLLVKLSERLDASFTTGQAIPPNNR